MGEAEPQTRVAQLASYADRLRAWGDLERVLPRLPRATRALLESPPHEAQWVPLQHNVDLFVAVSEELGRERVRTLAHEAVRDAIAVPLRPVLEMTLSAFGTSPATLLTHAESLLRLRIRGQTVAYKASTPTSGVVTIVVHGLLPPIAFFEAWAGVVAYAFDLCSTPGEVTVMSVEPRGEDQVGHLFAEWGPSK
jgi:hypothetical protein